MGKSLLDDIEKNFNGLKAFLNKEILKKILIFTPAYLLFISYLNLSFYYNYAFGIDVFKYITVDAIIIYSLDQIGFVAILSIFLIMLFFLKYNWEEYGFKPSHPPPEKPPSDTYRIISNFFFSFAFIAILTTQFAGIDVVKHYNKIDYGGIILLISLVSAFVTFFIYYLRNKRNYVSILMFIVLIITPVITPVITYLKSESIKKNIEYTYISGTDLKNYKGEERLKLIGKASEYYFLQPINSDSIILVRKYEDFENLNIKMVQGYTPKTSN